MVGIITVIVICVLLIACMAAKKIMFVKRRCEKPGYIVIPCTAKTKNLERTVRAYYWEEIFENQNLGREILLVIMEKSENAYTARRLAQEFSIVSAIDVTDLEDYIKKKAFRCGELTE
ncbi:hypothetical protein [Ruminococcus sp. Marseille-P6503]|uniref:hypothetical protein n=1 Tax=Ruminococcus sp. Marseille-P6503 TaxID=2364796 RepID=UPI000F51C870|nr:hypothetical protein [Ruminococcus sp. Marseille-P6503]